MSAPIIPGAPIRGFGSYLRRRREQMGMSLRGCAKAMGISPAYLSRVERGDVKASENLCVRAIRVLGLARYEAYYAFRMLPPEMSHCLLGLGPEFGARLVTKLIRGEALVPLDDRAARALEDLNATLESEGWDTP